MQAIRNHSQVSLWFATTVLLNCVYVHSEEKKDSETLGDSPVNWIHHAHKALVHKAMTAAATIPSTSPTMTAADYETWVASINSVVPTTSPTAMQHVVTPYEKHVLWLKAHKTAAPTLQPTAFPTAMQPTAAPSLDPYTKHVQETEGAYEKLKQKIKLHKSHCKCAKEKAKCPCRRQTTTVPSVAPTMSPTSHPPSTTCLCTGATDKDGDGGMCIRSFGFSRPWCYVSPTCPFAKSAASKSGRGLSWSGCVVGAPFVHPLSGLHVEKIHKSLRRRQDNDIEHRRLLVHEA
jgi:hypothetical protein